VELTPGERLILRQVRDLYWSTSRREHPLQKITSQWPAVHVEAYRGVLGSVISKNLIEIADQGRSLRITDAGMRAIGMLAAAEAKATIDLGSIAGDRRVPAKAPAPPVALKTRRMGLIGYSVFVVLAASAIVLLWLVLWPR
jgi:hypothetical protein